MKRSRQQAAFSKLDLLVMVLTVVGIGLMVLPHFARPRAKSGKINCVYNLKQVGLAFRIWSSDSGDRFPTQVSGTNGGAFESAEQGSAYGIFLTMSNELGTPKILYCRAESNPRRQMATAFTGPPSQGAVPLNDSNTISYFVGIDAHDTAPQTILSGDDHFNIGTVTPGRGLLLLATNAPIEWRDERHGKQGYIVFADGSVQGFATPSFRAALIQSGLATNRLAMP